MKTPLPVHINPTTVFAWYYHNSTNKIPMSSQHQQEVRSAVTGAECVL